MIRWQHPDMTCPPGFEREWNLIAKELLDGATVMKPSEPPRKNAIAAATRTTANTSMLQKLKLAGAIVILAGQTLWMLIRRKPIPKD